MRKPHTFLVFALGACVALCAVGIAAAEKPIALAPGNLELTFNDGLQIRRSVKEMRKFCEDAIVGEGSLVVSVAFLEQPPIPATSKLLLNGEGESGKPALYAYAYITQPITTPVKIRRQKNGRLRTKVTFEFPPIANGAGSVTSFNLQINKGLKVNGKPFSIVNASCPDRRLDLRGTAVFEDGANVNTTVTRPCTGKD
jgi:hypothetical protein